jgi:hypothetical protein
MIADSVAARVAVRPKAAAAQAAVLQGRFLVATMARVALEPHRPERARRGHVRIIRTGTADRRISRRFTAIGNCTSETDSSTLASDHS